MADMNQTGSTTQAAALKRKAPLLAAVLAVPFLAAFPAQLARAQFPASNGGGHANDANNRVGSGGYNSGGGTGPAVTSNDVVYGNVTGLRGFSGPLQSTDPTAFRGVTFRGSADQFIGQSNPAAVRGSPSANVTYYTPTPFYSDARGVAPPPGYVPVAGGPGGYVPANSNQAGQYPSQLQDQALGGAYRTGAGYGAPPDANLNPIDPLTGTYAPYGSNIRPGPLDLANQQSYLLVSPLSGIQQGQLNNSADSYFLSRTQLRQLQGADRFQRIDEQTLQQMRREVEENADQRAEQNPAQLNRPMVAPLESPNNKPLDATVGSSLNVTPQPLNGSVGTQEGMYRQLTSPAARQTPVLKELDRRLQVYQQHIPADMQREQAYEQSVASKNALKPGQPAVATPAIPGVPARVAPGGPAGVGPSVPLTPGGPKPDIGALAGGTRTEPVHITSLAAGVKAKGLANLLQDAETLMKQGKFASAINQYSLAQQVAPNNPLILLGKANAELGSGSYRDADLILREAFAGDVALLHAQFDLNSMMGPQRVRTLTDDLKDLAVKDPKAELPVFLLAYIDYNTGHEADAMKYLNDVEQREGHPDSVVARMRQHWYVPAAGAKPATPEMNK